MTFPAQPLLTGRTIGRVLQSTRKTSGLTQSEVAARLGISQSRVSYLEQHPEELSVQQLMAWSSVLGLELTIGPKPTIALAPAPRSTPPGTPSDDSPAW
jgi:HTH-type transcriptional regulator/antitoxin HipB